MTVEIEVIFPDGNTATYTSPTSFYCVTISHCPHWQPAEMLAWYNMPETKTAHFFESEDCDSTTGYSFSSVRTDANGSHMFGRAQTIRSMMVEEYSSAISQRPSVVARKCFMSKLIHLHESARVSDNETTSSATSAADSIEFLEGNTSSNWFDGLPDNESSSVSGNAFASFNITD